MSKLKRAYSVFLIFLLTACIVSGAQMADGTAVKSGSSAPMSQTISVGTVSASLLNVRETYAADSKIIGTLLKGANAYIINSYQGWYKITFNSGTGWVYGTYLSNIHPVGAASGAASSSSVTSSAASSPPSAVIPAATSSAASAASAAGSSSSVTSPKTAAASSAAASAPAGGTSGSGAASSAAPASSTASGSSVSTPVQPVSALPSQVVAGYYTAWSAYSGFTPDKIKASQMNVVHYAFAGVGADLKIAVGDPSVDYANFTRLAVLKKSCPSLKTLISIGGWDGSARFSDMAHTDATRKAFAQSCVTFIKQYGFDGVDIDWEYPVSGGAAGRPEDKTDFTLLMQALRTALNTQAAVDGRYYYLTFAGGASGGYIGNVQLPQLAASVDYAVDMTYDLHGPWDAYSDLNAPLYTPAESSPQYKISVDSSLRAWKSAGFPANKLVMGVPFYGYVYSGVSGANNGLYQRFTSAKSIGYDTIVSGYLSNSAFAGFFQSGAQVPTLFGGSTFISYDDAGSIARKAQYAAANGLRGVSAWELSYDRSYTLLGAVYNNLH